MNPFLATDGYKVDHHRQYPEGTTLVYSNFTPRAAKHAPKGVNKDYIISFGQEMVMRQIKEMFDKEFFIVTPKSRDTFPDKTQEIKNKVCQEIKEEYSTYLGVDYNVSHIEALWDLGYLPIKVKALPEGTKVPIGVPVLTIVNTKPEFFWLTNFLETLISNLLWKPMTSATIAYNYRQTLEKWAKKTDEDNVGFVDFQGHDFSMRGMDSVDATISSGLGHATSFLGSDSLPVIHGARKYYDEKGMVIAGVPATEHSVMCAGSKEDELGTFERLLDLYKDAPVLSIVSDTWDLWKVVGPGGYVEQLKDKILSRPGKLVIRPDSGDPVDIICGKSFTESGEYVGKGEHELSCDSEPEYKGVIELLWDIFGGTTNEQGYKVLDPHIGAIYGDSITLERADEICKRLEAKGFASTNIVLGIGSFTYQYNTRDTFGFAMKATYVEILNQCETPCGQDCYEDGVCGRAHVEGREIFKDPITDDGTKKSAKGLLMVGNRHGGENAGYYLIDQVDWMQENSGELQIIFEDGNFSNSITLTEIRENLKKQ